MTTYWVRSPVVYHQMPDTPRVDGDRLGPGTPRVEFRCAQCRWERRRLGLDADRAQLMGTATATSWSAVKTSRAGESLRSFFPFRPEYMARTIELRCRVGRHEPRRLPVAEVIRRAAEARDGGYDVVHV